MSNEKKIDWEATLRQDESLDTKSDQKNFDKRIFFRNVRELLRTSDIKLGQIENDAGLNAGYMSRLEKSTNTTEPTAEFVVTAAKDLGVSVDYLIKRDLTELTPPELYSLNFIDKLKRDTIDSKLAWDVEYKNDLDRLEVTGVNCVNHPLFSLETFYRQGETEYPDEVTDVVFVSRQYGCNTAIRDDCYKLRLKNGAELYIMSIIKDVYHVKDREKLSGVEIWMLMPDYKGYTTDRRFLYSSFDDGVIGEAVQSLYLIVKDYMSHPRFKSDVSNIIDAFMNDDFTDDVPDFTGMKMFDHNGLPNDDVPF